MSHSRGPTSRQILVLLYLCSLLLAVSYAPEPNPGPRAPKFPCGVCMKAVRWGSVSVCCDTCDVWYHAECMGMSEAVYSGLKNVSWECLQCGIPNFSSSIFDTTIFETFNTFNYLDKSNQESEISFTDPLATSSPKKFYSPQRKDIPLRLVVLNCQSIKSAGKPAQLQNIILSTQADIIMGSESWLTPDISSAEVFPSDFKVYRKDRTKGKGGGVFLLISNSFYSEEPEELKSDTDCEIVWAKIRVTGAKDLYLGSYYKPPSKTNIDEIESLRQLMSYIPVQNGAHLWIGGDFNLGDINWEDENVKQYSSQVTQGNQMINLTKDFFLEQMVTEPTRTTETTSSILDLFFTNNSTLVNQVHIIPGISDHEAVFIESSLKPLVKPSTKRNVYLYNKADYTSLRNELLEASNDLLNKISTQGINESWINLKTTLHTLAEKYIPQKQINTAKKTKPWIDRSVRSLMRKQKKLFEKQKKTKKPRDITRYKNIKAKTQREERSSYWQYMENIIDHGEDNNDSKPAKQKRFWNYINSLKKDNNGVAPLKENGKMHAEPVDKANILNRQYESVFTREDPNNVPVPEGNPFPSMQSIQINETGIVKLLQKLNPRKACGPDMITARLLRDLAKEISPLLAAFFQRSLDLGEVPEDWRKANVSAIFKKGDRFKASNYRPVSLTSICCKTLEHILTSNIMSHLEKHNILTDCQHGFRAKRSCETQLLTLADELASSLDKNIATDLIILDFSKAFDKVPHQRLLSKCRHYGIRGETLHWIESFLSNRSQRVTVEGATSDDAPVVSGVPQGTVLGPLLFLIFINDLPDCITSDCRLFADDCIAYRQIRDKKDCELLQQDLNSLAAWEEKWGMAFHPEKCNVLRVSRTKKRVDFQYNLKGCQLQEESSSKYLGVDMSSNLSWNTHIDNMVKKTNRTLGFLQRNLRVRNKDTKAQAYFAMVRPSLEYCASVWSPQAKTQTAKIEMVQRRAARYTCNRYRNTSSVSDMLQDLGWETLQSRRSKIRLTMFYKIQNQLVDIDPDKYLHHASTRTRANHSHKYRQISTRTDIYRHSFFPNTITTWNSLPAVIAEAPDLVHFKQGLAKMTF